MKNATLFVLVLSLCLTLCSCGKTKEISIYELQEKMMKADVNVPKMLVVSSSDSDAETKFAYLSDIDYSKVSSYFLAYAADGMAYEIAVICLRDKSDISDAKISLRKHLESRVNLYKTYEPTQTRRAEEALIIHRNNYIVLIMCDDTDAVKAAFEEFLK